MKVCFGDENQHWLMNIAVPPPRLLLLQARSVRKPRKPGGMTSVLSLSAFSHVYVTCDGTQVPVHFGFGQAVEVFRFVADTPSIARQNVWQCRLFWSDSPQIYHPTPSATISSFGLCDGTIIARKNSDSHLSYPMRII